MARRSEIAAVYAAGLVQGLALVTFPAAGAIFTSASHYGLSSTEYGAMFVPQAIAAIAASLLGAALTRRIGAKTLLLLGLGADLAAMALLVASRFAVGHAALAYGVLLVATGCLGAGFGLTVPTLNGYAAAFFPRRVDKAVLALNALLGSGTALAPAFVALFVGLGFWWGLPVLVGVLIVGLLLCSARLPLAQGPGPGGAAATAGSGFPPRFWLFAAFALLYGLCETMNGNWASLYMSGHLGASATIASLGLTVFWGLVTLGRLLFAATERWLPQRVVCRFLPLLIAAGFVTAALLGPGQPLRGVAMFAVAGLGCSALLPLVISFAEAEFESIAASMAGGLIAAYQIGYGIAAFGVGPLQAGAGLGLQALFGASTVVAFALAGFALLITRRRGIAVTTRKSPPTPQGEQS